MRYFILSLLFISCGPLSNRVKISPEVSQQKPKTELRFVALDPEEDSSFHLGQGFNSLTGLESLKTTNNIISNDKAESILKSEGGSQRFSASTFNSVSELFSAINLDISTHVGFKTTDLTVQTNIGLKSLKEFKTYSKNSYILIRGVKTFNAITLTDYFVKESSIEYYSKNVDRFYSDNGDQFVSSVYMGAQVLAVFECVNHTWEEKESLDNLINNDLSLNLFSGGEQLHSFMQKVNKASHDGCSIFVESKGSAGRIRFDLEHFVQDSFDFLSQSDLSKAVPVRVELKSYRVIPQSNFQDNIMRKIDWQKVDNTKSLVVLKKNNLRNLYMDFESYQKSYELANTAERRSSASLSLQKISRAIAKKKIEIQELAKNLLPDTNDQGWGEWEE